MTTPTDTKNQDASEEVSMKKFKRLILQMKLDPNYEMRILAEEEIINMFGDERERSKKLATVVNDWWVYKGYSMVGRHAEDLGKALAVYDKSETK